MPHPDDAQPQIAAALTALEKQLDRLVEALAHRPSWIAVDGARDEADALRQACEAYRTIDYDMTDVANETRDCLGVIGVWSDVIARAERVNDAKAELKRVCAPLARLRTRVPRKQASAEEGGSSTEVIQMIRYVLRRLGRSDLNLLAAYRRIPILGAPPRLVSYVRARTRTVHRRSVGEIETMLLSAAGPAASRDRARLAALSPRETHLAHVQEHYTNIRANVVYERLDKRGRGRIQIAAELPILYAHSRQPHPPEVRFPAPPRATDADTPLRIRQSKLQPHPYLQSLPIYRYNRSA